MLIHEAHYIIQFIFSYIYSHAQFLTLISSMASLSQIFSMKNSALAATLANLAVLGSSQKWLLGLDHLLSLSIYKMNIKQKVKML